MSRSDNLDVFVSSDQNEFRRKRKRLEKMINEIQGFSCQILENRGADSDDTRTRSIKATKKCDLYIGILGKEYSEITQKECEIALVSNKRNLIYIMDLRKGKRDYRVNNFIEKELKHRVSFHEFLTCKKLEDQIRKDLERERSLLLREGLKAVTKTKQEVTDREQELKDSIYSSSSPSNKNNVLSLLEMAKLNYDKGQYLSAFVNSSIYIELMIRRAVTEFSNKDHSKDPFHVLLRKASELNLLSNEVMSKLGDIWKIRNKTLHGGFRPSKNDVEILIDLASLLERILSERLEESPILTERDRRIIGTRFMQGLCEKDMRARRHNLNDEFSTDEIWDDYLGAFNKDVLSSFVTTYFQDKLNYIRQHPNGTISLTDKGRKHCREEIILPAGI